MAKIDSGKTDSGGALSKLMSLVSLAGGIMTGNPGMIVGGVSGISQQSGAKPTPNVGDDSSYDAIKRRLEQVNGGY